VNCRSDLSGLSRAVRLASPPRPSRYGRGFT